MHLTIIFLVVIILAANTAAFVSRLAKPAVLKLSGRTSPVLQRYKVDLSAIPVDTGIMKDKNDDKCTLTRLIGGIGRKMGLSLLAVWAAFLRIPKKVIASGGNNIRGWDLYGRVPNDEWLFSNYALTDPNLLKRSFVETVVQELPQVLDNFKRRKRINEILNIVSGLGYFSVAMLAIGLLYRTAMAANLKRSKMEESMGMGFSASAISKKSNRKGKRIEGMGDGWVDMEEDDDE